VLSQVPRPNIVNPGLKVLTSFLFLSQRAPLLEPWIIDRYGERGDYIGQQLNPGSLAQGFEGLMIMNWHPDGTRLVFARAPTAPAATPASRRAVTPLSSRAPVTSPFLPGPLPSLAWAPPLEGYVPPAFVPAPGTGAFSGTAAVVYATEAPQQITVTYTGYSDDGR